VELSSEGLADLDRDDLWGSPGRSAVGLFSFFKGTLPRFLYTVFFFFFFFFFFFAATQRDS